MKRRELLTLFGCLPLVLPRAVAAQQATIPVIGFLRISPSARLLAAFRDGLAESGYVEGRNLAIEYRWGDGNYDRLPALASELVQRNVALIAATGGANSVRAAMQATQIIPIVFTTGFDPAQEGLVASLARPGGNVTGVTLFSDLIVSKWLELLLETVPRARSIAMLADPTSGNFERMSRDVERAAQARDTKVHIVKATAEGDLAAAFATVAQLRADALLMPASPALDSRMAQVAALAQRNALPALAAWREFAAAGGLMSYGPSVVDAYRMAGVYAARILKGAKPGDLPIQQPTRFELVINMKAALALGMTIPTAVLARADELIE